MSLPHVLCVEMSGAQVRSVKPDASQPETSSKTRADFRVVTVRVRLPERYYIELQFLPRETMAELVAAVQGVLTPTAPRFDLFVAPPRLVLSDAPQLQQSFAALHLMPSAIVSLSMAAASASVGADGGSAGGWSLDHVSAALRARLVEIPPAVVPAAPAAPADAVMD